MASRSIPALLLAALLLPSPAGARPRTPPLLRVQLRVLVARCAARGKRPTPIRDRAWVDAHVAAAKRLFGAHRIALSASVGSFTPAKCALLSRADRHSMARYAPLDGVVNVLVMERVRNVDERGDLAGVHWRYRGRARRLRGRRWVFLTSVAEPPVLAHELGHFFSLPHSTRAGNVMTASPLAPIWRRRGLKPRPRKPLFTPRQGRRIRRALRRFLRKKR